MKLELTEKEIRIIEDCLWSGVNDLNNLITNIKELRGDNVKLTKWEASNIKSLNKTTILAEKFDKIIKKMENKKQ